MTCVDFEIYEVEEMVAVINGDHVTNDDDSTFFPDVFWVGNFQYIIFIAQIHTSALDEGGGEKS